MLQIVSLNDGMQKVKLRQQQLDHELDFIVAQQRELVECLQPLEKEFKDITVSDPERDSVYVPTHTARDFFRPQVMEFGRSILFPNVLEGYQNTSRKVKFCYFPAFTMCY